MIGYLALPATYGFRPRPRDQLTTLDTDAVMWTLVHDTALDALTSIMPTNSAVEVWEVLFDSGAECNRVVRWGDDVWLVQHVVFLQPVETQGL
jgi:hypothetical protein